MNNILRIIFVIDQNQSLQQNKPHTADFRFPPLLPAGRLQVSVFHFSPMETQAPADPTTGFQRCQNEMIHTWCSQWFNILNCGTAKRIGGNSFSGAGVVTTFTKAFAEPLRRYQYPLMDYLRYVVEYMNILSACSTLGIACIVAVLLTKDWMVSLTALAVGAYVVVSLCRKEVRHSTASEDVNPVLNNPHSNLFRHIQSTWVCVHSRPTCIP